MGRLWVVGLLASFFAPEQTRDVQVIRVQRRWALVVGNSAYPNSPLKNPVNDAADLSASLTRLGFQVTPKTNLTRRGFEQALNDFTRQVTAGDLALVYFAGHGVQVENENYLVPVDFNAENEADVPYEAFAASRLRSRLEATGAAVRVLILDACRNNPYKFKRSGVGGLAAMTMAAEGTIIAFAAGDNQTADDNRGERNGLYTKFLLQALEQPGMHLKDVFERTRAQVYEASRKKQFPALYDMVIGRLILKEGPVAVLSQPANSASAPPPSIRSSEPRPTRVGKDGLIYVWIPPGEFRMGCSPGDDECYGDERQARSVTIPRGFWMGQTEVTQEAFQRTTGKNPSHFKGEKLPVDKVTWSDAKTYCDAVGLRLPTTAEWEYAARAGSTASRYGEVGRIGWYDGNSRGKTHEVATREANEWGLHDLFGNVFEWTATGHDATKYEMRGGSWYSGPRMLRASARVWYEAESRINEYGFRCVGE